MSSREEGDDSPYDQDWRRDVWQAEVEMTEVRVLGQREPNLLLDVWEENGIGERRFVRSQMLTPGDDGMYR